MGNGDEPEQHMYGEEPIIDNMKANYVAIIDDLGYEQTFEGNIGIDIITFEGKSQVYIRMEPIKVRS